MLLKETIESSRTWAVREAATLLCDRYRMILKTKAELFVEMGLVLEEIERRELWPFDKSPTLEGIPCHSMDDWIHRASGTSNGTAYAALQAGRTLSHIPAEERAEIPRCNQQVLSKLSPAVSGDAEVLEVAKHGSNEALLDKIEKDHPNQHVETKRPMRFSPEHSARKIIDKAIAMCMAIEECGRDEALERICELYVEDFKYEYDQVRQEKANPVTETVQ